MRPRRELPKFHALRSVCSCLRGTNRQRHRRSNGQDKMRQKRLTGLDADLREPISIRCGGIVEAVGAGWALVACAEEHAARQPHLPPFIRALSLSTCTRPTLAAARGWNLRVQHSCCGPKASATAGAACAAFFASARADGIAPLPAPRGIPVPPRSGPAAGALCSMCEIPAYLVPSLTICIGKLEGAERRQLDDLPKHYAKGHVFRNTF
jgi:hypothetical protein